MITVFVSKPTHADTQKGIATTTKRRFFFVFFVSFVYFRAPSP
jgi:hypothetical protein